MLTEAYIEALLVDEDLADQVWELWNAGLIPDDVAAWAWWSIVAIRAFMGAFPCEGDREK